MLTMGLRLLLGVMCLTLLGCAQKPQQPAPPTAPLTRVAVLPVKMWPANGDAVSFSGATSGLGGVVFVPGNAAAIGPALIGTGLAQILALSKRRLAEAVLQVGFDPQAALEKRLWPALLAQQLPVVILDAPEAVNAVRAFDAKALAVPAVAQALDGVDAILDVQITSAGYYPAGGAGGYSPMMYVVATLLRRDKPGYEFARYGYDADYRPAEGEARFFTTPKSISAESPDSIVKNAELVRNEMDAIAARMVERIVIDVGQRIRNDAAPR